MRGFLTERRLKKITEVVKKRQQSLRLVMENIHDPHNVSAIYRTCDAVGVQKVTQIYTVERFPKLSRISSSSANKWVETEKFSSIEEGFANLKKEGFKIYSSILDENSKSIYEIDFTEKIAIVMGNENRGISDEVKEFSDELIYIPMQGMIQSLNVSVATAVILYEAHRQRFENGMYKKSELDSENIQNLIDQWSDK